MIQKSEWFPVLKTGLILTLYVACFTFLLVLTHRLVKDEIAENKQQQRMMLIAETLPSSLNALSPSLRPLEIPGNALIGQEKSTLGYQVWHENTLHATVFETVAAGGYGGPIRLIIALGPDLSLLGVRVLEHKETPGIGDYTAEKPSLKNPNVWLSQFEGRNLLSPPESRWKVQKDGGDFDYIAGATISPRAIVKGIKQALLYADQEKEVLFSTSTDLEAESVEERQAF